MVFRGQIFLLCAVFASAVKFNECPSMNKKNGSPSGEPYKYEFLSLSLGSSYGFRYLNHTVKIGFKIDHVLGQIIKICYR